jgi:putative membrane-bound dehydrogenase-like protein
VVERGTLAPGFALTVYARVPSPASITFGPDGRLYAASTDGTVYAAADRDGDERAEEVLRYSGPFTLPLGLAWVRGGLYVSYRGGVAAVTDADGDGDGDRTRVVVDGLPAWGLHQNDGLALGPDGYLYLGMGSTCDHCRERDPRSGTILRFRPDGSGLEVHAAGLRNPYDLAFNARGDLFATDNSRDDLGPDLPSEELNHIRAGAHYGWPECWAGGTAAPAAICAERVGPVAEFGAHTSADGLAFYHGRQFPEDYFDNAFVAILGSIYMFPADTERGVRRVVLTPAGDSYTSRAEWFLRLPEGRPVDVAVGPDGALYVADYAAGEVLRIVSTRPI